MSLFKISMLLSCIISSFILTMGSNPAFLKQGILNEFSETNYQYVDILLVGENWLRHDANIGEIITLQEAFLNLGILLVHPGNTSENILNSILQKKQPLHIIFQMESFNDTLEIFKKLDRQISLIPHHQTILTKFFLLFEMDEPNIFQSVFKPEDPLNFGEVLKGLKYLFHLNNDVYLILKGQSAIEIYEMYTIKNISIMQRLKDSLAEKTKNKNAHSRILNEIIRKAPRRTNFRKAVITGVVPRVDKTGRDSSYQVEENDITGEVRFLEGYRITEFRYLRDVMNFTENATVSNGFVSLSANGSLLGLGQVINDELADIAIPSNEIVPYRIEKLSFLIPSSSETHNAYFRQPPANYVRDIYRQSFSTNLWIGFFGIWIAFAMISTFIHWSRVSFYNSRFYHLNTFTSYHFDAGENIFSTLGVVCQQGWISPKFSKVLGETLECSTSIRLVMIFGLLSSLIFYGAYCASLVSILTLPVNPIKSFQEIITGDFILYGEKFTLAVDRILTQIIGNKTDYPELDIKHSWGSVQVDNDLIEKLLSTRSAFISSDKSFIAPLLVKTNYSKQSYCRDISSVPLGLPISNTGMFVKKHSPFREYFNYQILKMFEYGIRHRTEGQYKQLTTINCVRPRSKMINIGLEDSFTAFLIHGIGIGLSIISLGLEILVSKIQRKQQQAIFHS